MESSGQLGLNRPNSNVYQQIRNRHGAAVAWMGGAPQRQQLELISGAAVRAAESPLKYLPLCEAQKCDSAVRECNDFLIVLTACHFRILKVGGVIFIA